MSWLNIKAKLWGIGAAIMAALAFLLRFKVVKQQRDKARQEKEVLEATVHVQKVLKQIEKEEGVRIADEIKKIDEEERKESSEEFKGADNLTDSNDW